MKKNPVKIPQFLPLLILFGALTVSLLAAELFARIVFKKNIESLKTSSSDLFYYYDPQRIRRHIPNKTGYERMWDDSGKAEFKINSLGFRGDEITLEKPPGTTRICFLGDSITLGGRLPKELTFVDRVFQELKKFPHSKFEVINAGVGDIGLEEERALFESKIIKMSPDLVILCWYLNDGRPPVGFPEEKIYKNSVIQWLNQNGILQKSYLAGWLYNSLRQYLVKKNIALLDLEDRRFQWVKPYREEKWVSELEAFAALIQSAQFDWGDAWKKASLQTMFEKIKSMKISAQEYGVDFGIVALPVHAQVYSQVKSELTTHPQRQMEKFCRKEGIPFLDILAALKENERQGLFFDHCHYTPLGNEIVAQIILKFAKKTWAIFPS